MNTRKVTLFSLCMIALLLGGATMAQVWASVGSPSQSVEIGLLALAANGTERGYAVPASGHSAPDTPACVVNQGSSCQSTANVCGMRTTGTVQCDGSCSATPPTDAACVPQITFSRVVPNPTETVWIGQEMGLQWTTEYAATCLGTAGSASWIGPKSLNDYFSEVVTTSTTYQLRCAGPGGEETREVPVGVSRPIVLLDVDRSLVRRGDTVEVRWQVVPWTAVDPTATCSISGLQTELVPVTSTFGRADSSAISNGRRITLSCTIFGYTYTDEEFVEVIPTILEF